MYVIHIYLHTAVFFGVQPTRMLRVMRPKEKVSMGKERAHAKESSRKRISDRTGEIG